MSGDWAARLRQALARSGGTAKPPAPVGDDGKVGQPEPADGRSAELLVFAAAEPLSSPAAEPLPSPAAEPHTVASPAEPLASATAGPAPRDTAPTDTRSDAPPDTRSDAPAAGAGQAPARAALPDRASPSAGEPVRRPVEVEPAQARPLTNAMVVAIIEAMLGVTPSEAEVSRWRRHRTVQGLRAAVLASPAFRAAVIEPAVQARLAPDGQLASAEDLAVIAALLDPAAAAEPEFVVDGFGLRTPVGVAPDLAGLHGRAIGAPIPGDPRGAPGEFVALARSVTEAEGVWRGLALGAGRADLLLAGAVAARRRGLAPRLHASEAVAGRFWALTAHAEANGLETAGFRETAVVADPSRPARDGVPADTLLEAEPGWDWLRADLSGQYGALLDRPVLAEPGRVRRLVLVTRSRSDEATAVQRLARRPWRLIQEVPCRLKPRDPRAAAEPGVQVWEALG